MMKGFVQGVDRQQATLLPEYLDDWVDESNPVRAVDVFVDALELRDLGFDGVDPAATGRPGYHPSAMLKLYIFGYLNRVQSSRRLEREAGRNLEVMWLTGRLVPDHKTIADFRKDNGPAIKRVCAQFVALCRKMGLLAKASVAIDGSKFKAVNSRDNNFTKGKMERRLAQIDESVARYLSQLDTADRQTAAGEARRGSASWSVCCRRDPEGNFRTAARSVHLESRSTADGACRDRSFATSAAGSRLSQWRSDRGFHLFNRPSRP